MLFEPDGYIPIGNFKKTISNASKTTQEFERLLEAKRQLNYSDKVSRLNCIFTLKEEYAHIFKTDRKFLYELIVPVDVKMSAHNYNVGTYFSERLKSNDIELLKLDDKLMDAYWACPSKYMSCDKLSLEYKEEFLVETPLKINRIIPLKNMTIQEYINLDLPFYHITPTKNLTNIYANGIQNKKGRGICVTRSKHPLVIKYVTEMMLIGDGDTAFSIIEIIPSKHSIQRTEVLNDETVEATNPIHNYIFRKELKITLNNIIDTYTTDPKGIADKNKIENELKERGLILSLSK
jgi:hypothetical protein